jgi:hypothetical protein
VSQIGLAETLGSLGARRPGQRMTDDRDKTRPGSDSRARPTARDVPFTRSAGSESEPAPRGQRPNQLPRDPTYEAELAKVELAVLRDRDRRSDPSTKQGGRGHQLVSTQPPDSITPESPGARANRATLAAPQSGDGPSSSGRAVASGTLLSIGAVDPRGRTEPTLETPRMFFSQPEGREAYFKPGKIPAVTVHQTLETETVKLADSIDPRRAVTLPRIDRAALARYADADGAAESEAPMAMSRPATSDVAGSVDAAASPPPAWRSVDYEAVSSLGANGSERGSDGEGQIHASLSPFRDQAEPSFAFNEVPTRPEPLAARREAEPVVSSLPPPDTSAMPTQRDLPQHRIEASLPPPAPLPVVSYPLPDAAEGAASTSEAPSPTTASIAAPELQRRSAWMNYAAFFLALALAVVLGLWLTRSAEQASPPADVAPAPPRADVKQVERAPAPPPVAAPVRAPEPRQMQSTPSGVKPSLAPTVQTPPAAPVAPRKSSPPKPPRETIF